MTRRKWIKLRRQRPDLFAALPPFEKWTDSEFEIMRYVSKSEAISKMTSWKLRTALEWLINVGEGSPWDHLRLTNLTSRD